MRNILIITLLFISNLIFSQEDQSPFCLPIFNANLFSLEVETLKHSDDKLSFLTDDNYEMNFDTTQFIDGKKSVSIKGSYKNVKTYATLSLRVPIKIIKNTTVTVSVWVKTDSLQGENAGATLRLMGHRNNKTNVVPLFAISKSILKGSHDWKQISLTAVLKENENFIVLSGLMQGEGKTWFDNFTLKIDGEEIHDIMFFKNNDQANKVRDSLSKYITPIKINNLKKITTFISNQKSETRIIGLGEATHGTKEIFNYKAAIIKALIKNNNVTKIALESYYTNTQRLNTYILNGTGDIKNLIANLGFWPYYTNEFKELLIWLKEYNKTTNNKITIIGVDSQSGGDAIKTLTKTTKDNKQLSKLIKVLKNDSTPLSKKISLSNSITNELTKINASKNMLMTARALSQSYFLEQYKGLDNFRVRDSLQVLNIASIEKELSTNEKIIYWAHDMHVQKKANSAGGFLHEKYNNGYINLGFLLGTGKFTALDKETSKLNSNNVLTPIKCNALENIMSTYKYPVLLLKNRDAYDNPYLKNNLYNKILTKRSIGGLDKNNQFRTLSDNEENTFDFLIYIKNSNPSQLIN